MRTKINSVSELIRKVQEEESPQSKLIFGRGPAHEVIGARNYWIGFEMASNSHSVRDFARQFDKGIVREYTGSWEPKARALEGARVAVQLGLSKLTEGDIEEIELRYKYNPVIKEYPTAILEKKNKFY